MIDATEEQGIEEQLAQVVRTILAPMIAADGGAIEWVGLRGDVAEISLRGACAGCPGQIFTTRDVVLPALQSIDPRISSVRIVIAV